jgi:ATP-dependent Lon protease
MKNHLPDQPLPVLALRNLVIFPGISIPIRVGRPQSIAALKIAHAESVTRTEEPAPRSRWPRGADDLATKDRIIAVLQKPLDQKDHLPPDDLHPIGVLCAIEKVRGSDSEGYQLVLRGLERVALASPFEANQALMAIAEPVKFSIDADEATVRALLESVKSLAKQMIEYLPNGSEQMITLVDGINDLDFLINVTAANIDIDLEKKQQLLEQSSLKARALMILDLMQKLRDDLQVRSEIRQRMTSKLGKTQREILLREQLRAIQEELGEISEGRDKPEEDRRKIEDSGMPEPVRKIALDELKRLEALGSQSPETHVIRNYLDLLIALPWKSEAEKEIDLKHARETLDADHYGLDKIKKRIIEHLATMKLKKGGRGLILLFVGPPGVGKTSLGQSIAKALSRKFVRISLGGVRDDAEIRGHRRTYIGAMPGRIIQGIKRAEVNNPVFLLDEIDKLGRGFQGDPAAALLEVLDPEQNSTFTDHYLDLPYDLSKVLFIATANSLDSIPGPLLDRMELVELSGYTTAEKKHIALNHLLPKQLEEHGLKNDQIKISEESLLYLITHYTREAGVRDLQRKLAALARSSTTRIVEGAPDVLINHDFIEDSLGPVRFEHEVTAERTPPGVATGLAWTPVGGEILFIESALTPGQGRLTLTGQLGEVMKESAQIALNLIRSRLPQVSSSFEFDKKDLHIHVPAGAIPKDGPSAGIAILTSIASLFTGRTVDPRLAMSGEITLRGAVTPVGGIKEKVIAAHRAGVSTVILSRKNQRDLRDVPDEVRSQLRFHFVDDVAEVLRLALGMDIPAMDPNTGLWALAGHPFHTPKIEPDPRSYQASDEGTH